MWEVHESVIHFSTKRSMCGLDCLRKESGRDSRQDSYLCMAGVTGLMYVFLPNGDTYSNS